MDNEGASTSLNQALQQALDQIDDRAFICGRTCKRIMLLVVQGLPIPGQGMRISDSPHGRVVDKDVVDRGGATPSLNQDAMKAVNQLPDAPNVLVSIATFRRVCTLIAQAMPTAGTGARVYESPHGRAVDVNASADQGGASTSASHKASKTMDRAQPGILTGAMLKEFAGHAMAAMPVAGKGTRVYESPHGRVIDRAPPQAECIPAGFFFILADPLEDPYEHPGNNIDFTADGVFGDEPITYAWYVNDMLVSTDPGFTYTVDEADAEDIDEFHIGSIHIVLVVSNDCGSDPEFGTYEAVIHVAIPTGEMDFSEDGNALVSVI